MFCCARTHAFRAPISAFSGSAGGGGVGGGKSMGGGKRARLARDNSSQSSSIVRHRAESTTRNGSPPPSRNRLRPGRHGERAAARGNTNIVTVTTCPRRPATARVLRSDGLSGSTQRVRTLTVESRTPTELCFRLEIKTTQSIPGCECGRRLSKPFRRKVVVIFYYATRRRICSFHTYIL